jgi:hypothetical protein
MAHAIAGTIRPMDEWRTRLAEQLLSRGGATPSGADRPTVEGLSALGGATAMEIAFGKARSELTYILELGRAHHLPIVGSVVGDDIWIRLGESKLAFQLDRSVTRITATVSGRDAATLGWDARTRAIVLGDAGKGDGKPIDMDSFVRDAVDATVGAWNSAAPGPSSVAPPTQNS